MSTFKLDPAIEDELIHYGVKGMRWGVRRTDKQLGKTRRSSTRRERYNKIRDTNATRTREIEVTTKNGVSVKVSEKPIGKVSAFLLSLSKKVGENAANGSSFDIEVGGKKVGAATFVKRSSDEIYLSWLGINSKHRGQGYASAVFDAAVEYGKAEGVSKLTLEVPGNAPDARHIYEKRGFKVTKEPTAEEIREDIVWGGLTHMQLDLAEKSIRHSNLSEDEELELAFEQTFTQLTEAQEAFVFENPNPELKHYRRTEIRMSTFKLDPAIEDELIHYGVKGMRWGVRRDIKAARKERDRKKINATREFGEAEDRQISNAVAKQRSAKTKARESGASRFKANVAGAKAYSDAIRKTSGSTLKAEQRMIDKERQADAEYKKRKAQIKADYLKAKEASRNQYNEALSNLDPKTVGRAEAVGAVLAGVASVSALMLPGGGIGKSVVAGTIASIGGGLTYQGIAARHSLKKSKK